MLQRNAKKKRDELLEDLKQKIKRKEIFTICERSFSDHINKIIANLDDDIRAFLSKFRLSSVFTAPIKVFFGALTIGSLPIPIKDSTVTVMVKGMQTESKMRNRFDQKTIREAFQRGGSYKRSEEYGLQKYTDGEMKVILTFGEVTFEIATLEK